MKNKLLRNTLVFISVLLLNSGFAVASSYYLSPHGNDSNSGQSTQPWASFQHAFSVLTSGDTLILKDGLYAEPLKPPISGEAGNPISIIAENDGQAVIETVDEPAINIFNKNYLTVEGVSARTIGETNTVVVSGHDGPDWTDKTTGVVLRRVSAHGSSLHHNSAAFTVSRVDQVLLEDVWSFGHARNTMLVYGAENVTVRRAVIRWDGWWGDQYKPDDPRVGLSVYNTRDSLFENIIVLDGGEQGADTNGDRVALAVAGNHNNETAPFDDSSNNRYYGIILLNNVGAGVNAESGGDILFNNRFEHLVSWDNSRIGFNVNQNADSTSLTHGTVGANGNGARSNSYGNVTNSQLLSNLIMGNRKAEADGQNSFGVSGSASVLTDADYNNVFDHDSNYRQYSVSPGPNSISLPLTLEYLLEVPVGSSSSGAAHDGGDIGATIINRWIDGIETAEALWPYPYEDRIKDEMCDPDALLDLGRTGDNTAKWCEGNQTLTEYIWEYLGNPIPDDIYGDSQEPQIQWLEPLDQAQFYQGQDITLEVSASDSDGQIQSVDFYQNGNYLGTASQQPYTFTWTSVPVGNYALSATAKDNEGLSANAEINVTVISDAVAVATSEITVAGEVQSGSYLDTQSPIGAEVLVEQLSGGKPERRISRLQHQWLIPNVIAASSVELFVDAEAPANSDNDQFVFSYAVNNDPVQLLGQLTAGTSKQFIVALPPTTVGTVTVFVDDSNHANSGNNQADTLIIRQIKVSSSGSPSNQAPLLSIESPTQGSSFEVGTSIDFMATASDEDGDLSSYIVWSSSPAGVSGTGANLSINRLAIGAYTVTAEVSDSEGLVSQESILVNVTAVSSATSVSISDLDGVALSVGRGGKWRAQAEVEVRDDENSLVQGAIVAGVWSGGGSANVACTTGADGRCTVSLGGLKQNDSSAVLTVTGITDGLVYEPSDNYDPDGDSDGSTITVLRP